MGPLNEATRRQLLTELENFLHKFERYRELSILRARKKLNTKQSGEFWNLRTELQRSYGGLRRVIEEYAGRAFLRIANRDYNVFDPALDYLKFDMHTIEALEAAIGTVNRAIGALQSTTLPEGLTKGTTLETPKAFIAHGGQSARLRKLCDFLEALGVEPVVAEWSASEGRWTEEHVDKRMEDSDCDIILAEYGSIIDVRTGAKHPRLNVIDELARSRRIRPRRTILLLEKGVDLPSNTSGIVYERFTRRNMEKALIKVARELKEFGMLMSVKAE
jgi:predicted nucleotide-binding protein